MGKTGTEKTFGGFAHKGGREGVDIASLGDNATALSINLHLLRTIGIFLVGLIAAALVPTALLSRMGKVPLLAC